MRFFQAATKSGKSPKGGKSDISKAAAPTATFSESSASEAGRFYITLDENAQYYECGFSCDNALLLRADDVCYFLTDSRYVLEAKQLATKGTQVVESSSFTESLATLIKQLGIKHIMANPNELTIALYERLRAELEGVGCAIALAPNFHQKLRICKTPEEIKLIKKSQKLNKRAFDDFGTFLAKSLEKGKILSERQLHYHAKGFLGHFGEYDLSFDPIVGINENAAKPHALPSPKCLLTKGDLLLFDAGIKYKRYCSDMTRTATMRGDIHFGKKQKFKDPKMQKIYDIVRKAQERAITKARSGMKAREIDALARDVIEKSGYGEYFVHSTGHGIGLDIHELPRISRLSEEVILDGMVFSIEPGIYLPGEFGVRIEDLVVMRHGRAEIV